MNHGHENLMSKKPDFDVLSAKNTKANIFDGVGKQTLKGHRFARGGLGESFDQYW